MSFKHAFEKGINIEEVAAAEEEQKSSFEFDYDGVFALMSPEAAVDNLSINGDWGPENLLFAKILFPNIVGSEKLPEKQVTDLKVYWAEMKKKWDNDEIDYLDGKIGSLAYLCIFSPHSLDKTEAESYIRDDLAVRKKRGLLDITFLSDLKELALLQIAFPEINIATGAGLGLVEIKRLIDAMPDDEALNIFKVKERCRVLADTRVLFPKKFDVFKFYNSYLQAAQSCVYKEISSPNRLRQKIAIWISENLFRLNHIIRVLPGGRIETVKSRPSRQLRGLDKLPETKKF